MGKKKKNNKENLKRNSLTNKIVSLTVFLDALFLVLILGIAVLMAMMNQNQTRDTNAKYQNEVVVTEISSIFDTIEQDVHLLATDSDIINYLNYVNTGATPVLNPGDANYDIFLSYTTKATSLVHYQEDDLYDLVYVATTETCSVGTDGCGITHTGELSNADWALTERPWYIELGTKTYILTNPYEDGLTDAYSISFVEKVFDGEQFIGYIGIDIYMESLAALLDSLSGNSIAENNHVIIFNDIAFEPKLVYFSGDTYSEYFMQNADNYQIIDQASNYGEQGIYYILDNFSLDATLVDTFLDGDTYVMSSTNIKDTNFSLVTLYYVDQLIQVEIMFIILIVFARL